MSVYVDIAIAVILVFFTLSLVVTAMNEVVAVALNLRGRLLLRTLVNLLDDDALRARVLASAPLRAILRSRSGRDLPSAWRFPDWLPSREVARALLEEAAQAPDTTLVGALVAEARAAVEDAATILAHRYDDAMAQLSLRYKRQQQIGSAVAGIALAAALNVNVFAMAGALGTDPALREAISGQAEGLVARIPSPPPPSPPPGDAEARDMQALADALGTLTADMDGLRALTLPSGLGWTEANAKAFLASPLQMVLAVAAWVIAGLATVLGAPFWFDLLSRAVGMRARRASKT